MALMGYEVDRVRNDPTTGKEVSVPITWAYNHHYMVVSLSCSRLFGLLFLIVTWCCTCFSYSVDTSSIYVVSIDFAPTISICTMVEPEELSKSQ